MPKQTRIKEVVGMQNLITALRKIKQNDPVTFWLNMVSFTVGNIALILSIVRLYR